MRFPNDERGWFKRLLVRLGYWLVNMGRALKKRSE